MKKKNKKCGIKYAHGFVNKWCKREKGHMGPCR